MDQTALEGFLQKALEMVRTGTPGRCSPTVADAWAFYVREHVERRLATTGKAHQCATFNRQIPESTSIFTFEPVVVIAEHGVEK